jgi:hypothetical protein
MKLGKHPSPVLPNSLQPVTLINEMSNLHVEVVNHHRLLLVALGTRHRIAAVHSPVALYAFALARTHHSWEGLAWSGILF